MFQVWLREPRANLLRGALGGLAAQARLPFPTPLRAAVGDRPRPARRGGGMPRGSRRDHNVVDGAAAAMGGAALSKDMCSFPHLGLARRRRGRCRRGRVCGHPVAPTPSGLRCVTSPASFLSGRASVAAAVAAGPLHRAGIVVCRSSTELGD